MVSFTTPAPDVTPVPDATSVPDADAPGFAGAPPGWMLFDLKYGFARAFGPVWYRETGKGDVLLGFRCTERHMNPVGSCHGGALAAFADYAALSAQYAVGFGRIVSPTVTLSVDYLQGVPCGAWIEARTEITRLTGKMCFTRFEASVGGEAVMSSRAIFKLSQHKALTEHPFYQEFRALWPHRVALGPE